MNAVFDSNLRLFKSTDTTRINWGSESVHSQLKVLVVALLADSQEDLIVASALSQLTAQELKNLTRVKHEHSLHDLKDGRQFDAHTLVIAFPNRVYKNHSFTFISEHATTTNKTRYTSLLMTHSLPKLSTMLTHWIKSQYGVISKPATFDSKFIVSVLDTVIRGLPGSDKSRLGNVELAFQTHTTNNALSSISVEITNKEIEKFSERDESDILIQIIDFLKANTSIQFDKLPIVRFKCKFLAITSEGRLKFQRGIPTIGESDVIGFTAWDFIQKIYDSL